MPGGGRKDVGMECGIPGGSAGPHRSGDGGLNAGDPKCTPVNVQPNVSRLRLGKEKYLQNQPFRAFIWKSTSL